MKRYERWERRQGSIVAPMVTKPTLPDGMCLPTGYRVTSLKDEYLPSRIPSRLGQIRRERRRLRRREVEEEGQQRCLMEDAYNGIKDERSVLVCA